MTQAPNVLMAHDFDTTRHPQQCLLATQGGGYALWDGNEHVWYEVPEWMANEAQPGDPIPEEWGTASTGILVDDPYPEDSDGYA